jgi:transcriptional regulator with XRE-family HTH domain
MDEIKKTIGKRLREIRAVFLEGDKVSGRQFANALGETQDNIANYENGRASIPNRLLLRLYERGFNPVYLLSGEGSIFADNHSGRALREKVNNKKNKMAKVHDLRQFDYSKLSIEELEKKVIQYQVAAGDIMRIIQMKRADETEQN